MIPKLVATVALTALNAALNMSRRIKSPRPDNTTISLADNGTPIARFWAKKKLDACPIIFAEEMTVIERETKTKAGKQSNSTNLATWAVAIACHEIAATTRIWMDEQLVLDLTGAGPVAPFSIGYTVASGKTGGTREISVSLTDHMRIYLGTEDQEIDPRIQATTEARHGAGSASAFRGMAYVVFEDLPVEKFGNRPPTVSVEAVGNASPAYPYEKRDTIAAQPNRLWNFTFSTDFSRLMWVDGFSDYEIWDVAARARMISGTLDHNASLTSRLGMYADGTFLVPADGGLYSYAAEGLSSSLVMMFTYGQQEVRVLADADDVEHWMTIPFSVGLYFYRDGSEYLMADLTGVAWQPCEYFNDDDGSIWAVGRATGTGQTTAYFYRIAGAGAGPDFVTVTGLAAQGGAFAGASACFADGAFVLFWSGGPIYRIDPADGSILASRTDLTLDAYNYTKQVANLPPGSSSIWLNAVELDLSDLTTIRTVTLGDWSADDADGIIYDPVNHALITAPQLTQEIAWRYLDRVGAAAVTLRQVVEDVSSVAGAPAASIDATALAQTVDGYSVASGTGKDWLDPLLEIHDVDPRPHDNVLAFVPRGGAAGATIDNARFAQPKDNSPLYDRPRSGATELPARVTLDYADSDADQKPNFAVSGPLEGHNGRGIVSLNMASLALTPDDARGMVGRWHRRTIFEGGQPYSLALSARDIALEPADVRTLGLPGDRTVTVRLKSMQLGADRQIVTEWLRDDPSLALFDGTAGAPFGDQRDATIALPAISKGLALDIPLISDAHEASNPLLYFAAGPYDPDTFWPGASMLQAVSGEYSSEVAALSASDAMTWGIASDALGDADANLWDRGNSVNVMPGNGTFTGTTEAAIDANRALNLAAIGAPGRWELVQFAAATLEADGSYTLSDLKRGRRGTEWATGTHQAGDVFVLLDRTVRVGFGLSDVGTELDFKAVTTGRSGSGAFPIAIDFAGVSKKPWAPIDFVAEKLASGDWKFDWTRRTRIGGYWSGGSSIPLGEATEQYDLQVGDGVSSAVKTPTSETYTWTVADQVTDTGAEVMAGSLEATVWQISATVDRGYPTTLAA